MVCSDNLDVLRELPDESIDLIYLDPPFQSDSHYVAIFGDKGKADEQLRDIWKCTTDTERALSRIAYGPLLDTLKGIQLIAGGQSPMSAYCVYMARRLAEMHRVLKDTGSIYLHCDYHANHYLRLLLDTVFGKGSLRNEIVWNYRRWPAKTPQWQKMHDTIFWYSKGRHWTWNQLYEPLADSTLKADGGKKILNVFDENGRRVRGRKTGEKSLGAPMRAVWDIGFISPTARERLGYPTQKPLALLERIIKASSNEGDLVLDPFCGCGTAVDAAAKLGRRYLGIDISAIAVRVMAQRLTSREPANPPSVYGLDWSEWEWEEFERMALRSRDDAEDNVPGWAWAEDKMAGLLNAIPNSKKTGDRGVDARYFTANDEVVPIQVKMRRSPIGRPDLDRLLGAQTAMQNEGVNAPMSLLVSLYPPKNLLAFAARQGRVTLGEDEYPKMQVLSVEEMLTKGERPKLPPVDPRTLVGNTQSRLVI